MTKTNNSKNDNLWIYLVAGGVSLFVVVLAVLVALFLRRKCQRTKRAVQGQQVEQEDRDTEELDADSI